MVCIALMGMSSSCDLSIERTSDAKANADTTGLATLVEHMRLRALKKDTLFCASALTRFDDPAVAAAAPIPTGRAFQHYRYALQRTTPEFIARFDRLIGPDSDPVLADWSTYFHGAAAYQRGQLDSTMSLYEPLVDRFLADHDTLGAFYTAYRLGSFRSEMYLDPQQALPDLRRALHLARTLDQRNKLHVELAVAHSLSGAWDSTEVYVRRLELDSALADQLVPNDPWTSGIRRRLRFRLMTQAAVKDTSITLDTLRRALVQYHHMMDHEFPWANWNRTADLVPFAQMLLSRGSTNEAWRAFRDCERRLDTCANCAVNGPAIYEGLARIAEMQGDLKTALHYQQALRTSEKTIQEWHLDERMRRLEETSRMSHLRDSVATVNERERLRFEMVASENRWQRFLFLMLLGFITLIAALLINRARLKRRIHLEQLRSRLSRDLHDDIGGTLSSISILSNVAKKRAEASGDADAAASMEKISERSQRLMRDMSDIVWSVDPGKDSVTDLIGRMREFGTSVLEPKGIAFHFNAPENVLARELPVEVKKNLYLIFKEAVNNAAKHAGARGVFVDVSMNARSLHVQVEDDGAGMRADAPVTGHGGNGLRNMRARAQEIGALFSTGTSERGGVRVAVEFVMN
jgi:signal transduction histidine kinase